MEWVGLTKEVEDDRGEDGCPEGDGVTREFVHTGYGDGDEYDGIGDLWCSLSDLFDWKCMRLTGYLKYETAQILDLFYQGQGDVPDHVLDEFEHGCIQEVASH